MCTYHLCSKGEARERVQPQSCQSIHSWTRAASAALLFFASLFLIAGCGGEPPKPPPPPVSPPPPVVKAVEPPAKETPADETAEPKAEPAKPAAALGDSSIKGKASFKGTAPKMANINMAADKVCKSQHDEAVTEQTVIVNENGTLKNVLVYVSDGLPETKFTPPAGPVTINQEGCLYSPHVFGLMTNQTLQILNSDPVLHNIHSLPNPDKGNKSFNFGQPNKGDERKEQFEFEEIVKFKCDVHGWMNAYAGVFSHPYFAVTSDDGTFELKGLPAGKYTITAWHEHYGNPEAKTPTQELTQEVEVGEKESKEIEFGFEGK